jgi:hypothetical protein
MDNPFDIIDTKLTSIKCLLFNIKYAKTSAPADIDQLLIIWLPTELIGIFVLTLLFLASPKRRPLSKKKEQPRTKRGTPY